MTIARVRPEHDDVEVGYALDGQVRGLGIVGSALVLVDDAGRTEGASCR